MKLYQAENGYMGESYVRVYVWAKGWEEARALAEASFERAAKQDGYDGQPYCAARKIVELFDASSEAFATRPSDAGWRKPEAEPCHT